MTAKNGDKPVTREEKVEEIQAILGELFQRYGFHQAAPGQASLTVPDYRFVGYVPYPVDVMPPPLPAPLMSRLAGVAY
jgi:hypothetical protein